MSQRAAGNFGGVVADRGQIACEILRRGVPAFGVLGQTPLDDPAQGRRHAGVGRSHRLRLLVQDGRQRVDRVLLLERALSGRHLVEDRSEGELIRSEVHELAAGLLRRHVAGRAEEGPRARPRLGHDARVGVALHLDERQLGETEVEDLDDAVLRDHHVFWLQVAVHDPGFVGLGQALGDLGRDGQQSPRRNRAVQEQAAQRLTLDLLHRDPRRSLRGADVVNRHDVRVIQGRRGPRLRFEALEARRLGGELRGEDLDRDLPG